MKKLTKAQLMALHLIVNGSSDKAAVEEAKAILAKHKELFGYC